MQVNLKKLNDKTYMKMVKNHEIRDNGPFTVGNRSFKTFSTAVFVASAGKISI